MNVYHPAPVGYKDIDLSWMVGRVISAVAVHEPTLWNFTLDSDANIGVECLWRIIERDKVVVTSEDHRQQFGLPAPVDAAARGAALLAGQGITSVQLREATADILIDFGGHLRLEIIPTSAGYESWQLRDPHGTCYVAQGGGQICMWTPSRGTGN
jgi:hypothetical protein